MSSTAGVQFADSVDFGSAAAIVEALVLEILAPVKVDPTNAIDAIRMVSA